jgi:hypothetical protein
VTPPARVDVILARRAPRAVVFRRGPSKWTLVLDWNTETDTFMAGDWFRGRIYSRRGDLTPDGEHLVYFAATFGSRRQPAFDHGHSWTAISEVPRLAPLGLWAKTDCWWGGGSFETNRRVTLNERPGRLADAVGQHRFDVAWDEHAGGEDEPIYGRRLERDGWTTTQQLDADVGPGMHGFVTVRPQVRTKRRPRGDGAAAPAIGSLEARWSLEGFESVRTWSVVDERGGRHPIAGATWADWDQRGRLVAACDGTIVVVDVEQGSLRIEPIIDLNPFTRPTTVPSSTRSLGAG